MSIRPLKEGASPAERQTAIDEADQNVAGWKRALKEEPTITTADFLQAAEFDLDRRKWWDRALTAEENLRRQRWVCRLWAVAALGGAAAIACLAGRLFLT